MSNESDFFFVAVGTLWHLKGHGSIRQVSFIFLFPQLCSQTHLVTQLPILKECNKQITHNSKIHLFYIVDNKTVPQQWTTKLFHSRFCSMMLISLIITSNWYFSTPCPFKQYCIIFTVHFQNIQRHEKSF